MVKTDSTQKNVRLRNDAWFALEELQERWECKRDSALERAIEEAHSSGIDLIKPEPVAAPLGVEGLRAMIAERQGGDSAVGALPKNATCQHCSKKFTGARFATVCPACSEEGHGGDVRECRSCSERDGAI